MTYCVGVLLEHGMIFASDSRTNAGLDNIAKFSKMSVFERPGDRVIVMLSSGNLAGTQAVIVETSTPSSMFGRHEYTRPQAPPVDD